MTVLDALVEQKIQEQDTIKLTGRMYESSGTFLYESLETPSYKIEVPRSGVGRIIKK